MVKTAALFSFFLLLMTGCAGWDIKNNGAPPPPPPVEKAYPFIDIPVPPDFSRNEPKSWIYESGSGTVKVARLFFSGHKKQEDVLTFYQNEMLNNGWTLVNSVKTEQDQILNYTKEGWVSTIKLHSNFLSTFIEIQAGPK
ncbi:MAG: hypothetical protein F3742_00255 [Nitrospinae bacterium]|nr:hypothetical protein [Nitrospinota bacterium]